MVLLSQALALLVHQQSNNGDGDKVKGVAISDKDRSAALIGHLSDLHFPGDLIGHCSTDRQSLFN